MGKRGKPSLSTSKVARKVRVSRSYLSRVLSGKQIPSLPVACRIAGALNISLEQIAKLSGGDRV